MSHSKTLIAASLLVFSGAVFAGEITDFPIGTSTATRAQVWTDLAEAQKQGAVSFGEAGPSLDVGASTASREKVIAETKEALRLGLIPSGDSNPRMATPEEANRIRMASQRY